MEILTEDFLRKKLEDDISSFGDGVTEFHTRDINHLLICLGDKDLAIEKLNEKCNGLINQVNFDAERQFKELLTICMTINNLSAEERLRYIRNTYKELYTKLTHANR